MATDIGLMRMAARTAAVGGTAAAVSGRVARRQADKYGAKVAPFQNLAQLNSQAILSNEEFAPAKAKALGI